MKHKILMQAGVGLLITGGLFLVAPAARASVVLTNDGTGRLYLGSETIGYEFKVTSDKNLSVTALGIWDDDSSADNLNDTGETGGTPDGLVDNHVVGLWESGDVDNDGTPNELLASVSIPQGTPGTVIGEFRYLNLNSPVTLLAGQRYVLGVTYDAAGPDDLFHLQDASPTHSDDIDIIESRFDSSSPNLTFPTKGNKSGQAYVGPNAQYTVVPEPGSLTLLGLAGLALLRQKRR